MSVIFYIILSLVVVIRSYTEIQKCRSRAHDYFLGGNMKKNNGKKCKGNSQILTEGTMLHGKKVRRNVHPILPPPSGEPAHGKQGQ
jgi:hypothetical protein